MNMALACGGTGGHVLPGLATAEALRRRGHTVTLWLSGKDVERDAIEGWDGEVVTIPSRGLPRGRRWRNLAAGWSLVRAGRLAKRRLRENPPDVLLAMGSYASYGPLHAARRLRIPYVLHEANVLPGKVVTLFARHAAAIGISFEESRFHLKGRNVVLTGMPLRHQAVAPSLGEPLPGLDRDLFTLLVMGGSRGASSLNRIVSRTLCELARAQYPFQVVHLTGHEEEEAVRARYRKAGVPHQVYAFTQDMAAVYHSVDLAICRSGASTCAELGYFAVPALLVPYPHAARDHQTANARALEKQGAADVVPETELNVSWLKSYLQECVRAPERLARMSAAARARIGARPAAEELAELVETAAVRQAADHGANGHAETF